MAIVYFPQSSSEYSNEAYLLAHYGFFLCNVFNVSYILVFEWLIFERRTRLSATAFSACFLQLLSCVTSIHRSNIESPNSHYGSTGALLGLLAMVGWNIVAYHVGFHWSYRKYLKRAWVCFLLGSIIAICLTYRDWATDNDDFHEVFFYFRVSIGISMVWQLGCYISGYWAYKMGRTKVNPAFLSEQGMSRAFKVCIFLQICYISCMLSGIPILQYPGTGVGFVNMVLIMVFVGKMDYMGEGNMRRREFEVTEMYTGSVADLTERGEPSSFFTVNIPQKDERDVGRIRECIDEDYKPNFHTESSMKKAANTKHPTIQVDMEGREEIETEGADKKFERYFVEFVKTSTTRTRSSFTPKAKLEDEVRQDAVVTFILYPEKWRVAAYLFFWFMAGVAYIISETSVKDYLQAGPEDGSTCGPFAREDEILGVVPGQGFDFDTESHLVGIFGYNNLCVYWDYYPSREITALIYPLVEYSLVVYVLLDFVASILAYKRGELTEWFYTTLKIVSPVAAITPALFRMVFVSIAYEHIEGHTAGFLSLQICLFIICVHNSMFIWMTKTSYEFLGGLTQTRLVTAAYFVAVVTISVVKIGSTLYIVANGAPPAFAKKYVNGKDGLVSGQLLDYFWMLSNAILPLAISIIRCKNEFPLVFVVGQDAIYFEPEDKDSDRLKEIISRNRDESEKWLRKEHEDSFKMNTIRRIAELRREGFSDLEIVEWFPDAALFLQKQPSPNSEKSSDETSLSDETPAEKDLREECRGHLSTPAIENADEYAVHEI